MLSWFWVRRINGSPLVVEIPQGDGDEEGELYDRHVLFYLAKPRGRWFCLLSQTRGSAIIVDGSELLKKSTLSFSEMFAVFVAFAQFLSLIRCIYWTLSPLHIVSHFLQLHELALRSS